jgi:CubicO group peptidase (beta-lactamase class C family)
MHTSDWQPLAPAEAGFAPDLADRLAGVLRAGRAPKLHGVVVIRHGRLVLEHYGAGQDFKWNQSLGAVSFGPNTLHDIRSVTKSVVGLLYGIALAGGHVPEPDEPLLPHFPEYPDLAADAQRARLTVEHALTMTLGLEWNEDVPYTSAANSEIAVSHPPLKGRCSVVEHLADQSPGAAGSRSFSHDTLGCARQAQALSSSIKSPDGKGRCAGRNKLSEPGRGALYPANGRGFHP